MSLIVERRNGQLRAIVEDDGRGFDPEGVMNARGARRKLGLKGMEERVVLAGERLDIETAPEVGTTIYVLIPLPADTGDGGSDADSLDYPYYREFFEALIPMPQARAFHKLVWRIYLDEVL